MPGPSLHRRHTRRKAWSACTRGLKSDTETEEHFAGGDTSQDTHTYFSLQGVDGEHKLGRSTKRNEFDSTERNELFFCQCEKNLPSDTSLQELDYCGTVVFAKGLANAISIAGVEFAEVKFFPTLS